MKNSPDIAATPRISIKSRRIRSVLLSPSPIFSTKGDETIWKYYLEYIYIYIFYR